MRTGDEEDLLQVANASGDQSNEVWDLVGPAPEVMETLSEDEALQSTVLSQLPTTTGLSVPDIGDPSDSLSLVQLRKLVTELPRADPATYAFEYDDAATFGEEIDEWFMDGPEQQASFLASIRGGFESQWRFKYGDDDWPNVSLPVRKSFLGGELERLAHDQQHLRHGLQSLLYVCLGTWAFIQEPLDQIGDRSKATSQQSLAIHDGVLLLIDCGAVEKVYEVFREACDRRWDLYETETKAMEDEAYFQESIIELSMTLLYVVLETSRSESVHSDRVVKMEPALPTYLVDLLAKMRWHQSAQPLFFQTNHTHFCQLLWKSMLVVFDDLVATDEIKTPDDTEGLEITASPLNFHLFRQEIISKYPAYTPPALLVPLEPNQNTFLPHCSDFVPRRREDVAHGGSILDQPVHIATPAPSPPPSPSIGGKVIKKQNYQTNQHFPFMYPPLDDSSISAGTRGLDDLQRALVDRKWEGSDIPASILEAGEIFASRTKMTRSLKNLWDERVRFQKFERGWDLDPLPDEVDERLQRVDKFYRDSLPHLQSLVIVLLESVLSSITALIAEPIYPQVPVTSPEVIGRNGEQAESRNGDRKNSSPATFNVRDITAASFRNLRRREINSKAVSGLLLVMLKWLKVSHVLKFEYLAQLLLDSNYVPLILKLFAHSDIDRIVDCNVERPESTFFHYCNAGQKVTPRTPSTPASPRVRTDYSWRNLFSAINWLRIMQKLCKNKSHRNLLLVQYKSTPILRKGLRIPEPTLRLYTLKLFKNQVPYTGRKWRQGNMRIITAIYLHCRPELRDDWLAGADTDADVEEALPLEQALRALTQWHNLTRYPAQCGLDTAPPVPSPWFVRELGRLGGAGDAGGDGIDWRS